MSHRVKNLQQRLADHLSDGGTDYEYAWRNAPHWTAWYWRRGRFAAGLRDLWRTVVYGDIGEKCQECGRSYLLWHAPDKLWRKLVSKAGNGLVCPACFDRKVRAKGYTLVWSPFVWMRHKNDGTSKTHNAVFHR